MPVPLLNWPCQLELGLPRTGGRGGERDSEEEGRDSVRKEGRDSEGGEGKEVREEERGKEGRLQICMCTVLTPEIRTSHRPLCVL